MSITLFRIGFSRYRDIQADDAPKRTEPAYPDRPDSPWVRTILDEAEWLARPDHWGVDALPEPRRTRQQKWANHYSLEWHIQRFLNCEVCLRLLRLIVTDSGWFPERLTPDNVPDECPCGSPSIRRSCDNRIHNIITDEELLNRLGDYLYGLVDITNLRMEESERRAFRRRGWEYGNWLTLELIGPNPFRPIVLLDDWRTSTAVAIAQTMYDSRDFAAMPMLADALEDAGCTHTDILDHCRGGGPHVRGCWVVDLVLNKS